MSWFSSAIRKVAKNSPALKAQSKIYDKLGISSGNTLRRAIDPGSIQVKKIQQGAPINARLFADPGNELQAAPVKQGVNAPQINPLTGQPGTNARDLIAQQMGAPPAGGRPLISPGIGNAGSPTYGLGDTSSSAGTMTQIPTTPTPHTPMSQPDYGDINAIQQYVQGKMSAPGAVPPMGTDSTPQKRPMFGGPRMFQ